MDAVPESISADAANMGKCFMRKVPSGASRHADKTIPPKLSSLGGTDEMRQPAEYSFDLNDRCFTPSGASEILRMLAQVCL